MIPTLALGGGENRLAVRPGQGLVRGTTGAVVPGMIATAGESASKRYIEFFTAQIRNPNTRAAYGRALIGLMTYSFARISAALAMNEADVFPKQHRLWVRLNEKGGKHHEMPCHHTLELYLREYRTAAGAVEDKKRPLFRTIDRQTKALSERRLQRSEALRMVKRRAKQAGIAAPGICNHTFRGTGITAYLEHPEAKLEHAQQMAAHSDPKTTRLYDRRSD